MQCFPEIPIPTPTRTETAARISSAEHYNIVRLETFLQSVSGWEIQRRDEAAVHAKDTLQHLFGSPRVSTAKPNEYYTLALTVCSTVQCRQDK